MAIGMFPAWFSYAGRIIDGSVFSGMRRTKCPTRWQCRALRREWLPRPHGDFALEMLHLFFSLQEFMQSGCLV